MICNDCKMGAHWNGYYIRTEHEQLKKDFYGKTRAMHALCKDKGCLCQHIIGNMIHK